MTEAVEGLFIPLGTLRHSLSCAPGTLIPSPVTEFRPGCLPVDKTPREGRGGPSGADKSGWRGHTGGLEPWALDSWLTP